MFGVTESWGVEIGKKSWVLDLVHQQPVPACHPTIDWQDVTVAVLRSETELFEDQQSVKFGIRIAICSLKGKGNADLEGTMGLKTSVATSLGILRHRSRNLDHS